MLNRKAVTKNPLVATESGRGLTAHDSEDYLDRVPIWTEPRHSERIGIHTRRFCGCFPPFDLVSAGRATDTRPARGRSPLDCVRVLASRLPGRLLRLRFETLMQERSVPQSIRAVTPAISIVEGFQTVTSDDLAKHFGKQHRYVLNKITELQAHLSPAAARQLFRPSRHIGQSGRSIPSFLVTRDGFTLLAMGFTGKRALAFKLAYLAAFNHMEVKQQSQPRGYMRVRRQHISDLATDLGRLRARIDGLAMMESDLPPSWWQSQRISY